MSNYRLGVIYDAATTNVSTPDTIHYAAKAMKIALPSCVSARSIEAIFAIATVRINENRGFRLLIDMSAVNQIEQDGLTRLYDLTQLAKSRGAQKIIIRSPNRVVLDALILSNTLNLFELREDA